MENYELIITEKPQAAMKIAYALADIAPVKRNVAGVPYYEIMHNDKPIVIACAVGHLFGLAQTVKGSDYPIFEIAWKPSSDKKASAYTKKYTKVIETLAKKASSFTLACDYDIEGEVIGWNALRFLCKQNDANRMKFSALTKEDITEAYEKKMKTIDWGMAYAGETRHYLDFYYGINLSRALMAAIKKAGAFRIFSIGRVQGPALALIVDKEKSILAFKSKLYWQVALIVENDEKIEVRYPKDIFDKKEAEEFKKLKGKKGIAKTEKKEVTIIPPTPFDLTTLQMEAYKFFNIAPAILLQIAQQLYLAGVISYPRTSSQKLPVSIGYEKIINKLGKSYSEITKLAKRKVPIEGSKSDPAHPSIYPTGEKPSKLTKEEEKVYDLIVRRFLACFGEDALLEDKKIIVNVEDKEFNAKGSQIRKKGWLDIYKTKLVERELPDINGEVTVKEVKVEEKETQPPRRFTPASLVAELAKRNLGTKSTRALIIDTLFKRGYVEGASSIKATGMGMRIEETLKENCPAILDEELTRRFEKEMDAIQLSKHSETIKVSGALKIPDFQAKAKTAEDKVLHEAQESLTEICKEFKEHELEIGKELVAGREEMFEKEKLDNTITQCPVCKKGNIIIRKSRFGKQFLACDKYPDCKTTFSLPPYGFIKRSEKQCECGWPILMALQKGKRPWEFCANPLCPTRKNKAIAKPEKKAEEKQTNEDFEEE